MTETTEKPTTEFNSVEAIAHHLYDEARTHDMDHIERLALAIYAVERAFALADEYGPDEWGNER